MLQKFELNELTENKVISIKLENCQHVRHRHENMTMNGRYLHKHFWSVEKRPVLKIFNAVPGNWFIISKGNKTIGYKFVPKVPSNYHWEIHFD